MPLPITRGEGDIMPDRITRQPPVTSEGLCKAPICFHRSDPDFHHCFACGSPQIEHAHVEGRGRAPGKKHDPLNVVALCTRHHRMVDETHECGHAVRKLGDGLWHYFYWEVGPPRKELCDRVLGGGEGDGSGRCEDRNAPASLSQGSSPVPLPAHHNAHQRPQDGQEVLPTVKAVPTTTIDAGQTSPAPASGGVAAPDRFQLFPLLQVPEYEALKQDIREHGLLIPLEYDEEGELLDGFHRRRACEELGIRPATVTRHFETEETRLAHVIALNLKRRHLDPVTWGEFFMRYCEIRGVVLGQGARSDLTSVNVSEVAAELGVQERTARRRLQAARLPERLREKVRTGQTSIGGALKEQRTSERSAAEPPPLPTGTYRTIVADPPWAYDRADIRGSAEGHYATMSVAEIAALPIANLVGAEGHLYLWVTNPHLPIVWPILEAWGFEYKTLLTWVKPQMGTGFYFRSATEHVIFAARANLPLRDRGIANWFEADRTEHSAKPESFYEIVERASHGPYLELFARRPRGGWQGWGDEL
jgi:N6-adenosine-specific RNA methylase IME4